MEKNLTQNQNLDEKVDNLNENLTIYNQFKQVPDIAKKTIAGGKLSGFTDINPMWRIKRLTEIFGPCGIAWKAPIVEKWAETGANGEVIANVKIQLFIKYNGEWSEPIDGIGGSMLINTEKSKLTTNDEAYKMAYTDAISVACKMLGGGADVYFEKDRTKYDIEGDGTTPKTQNTPKPKAEPTKTKYQTVKDLIKDSSLTLEDVESWAEKKAGTKQINKIPDDLFNEMIKSIKAKIEQDKKNDNA